MTIKRIEDENGWRWYCQEGQEGSPANWYASVTNILSVAVPEQLKKYFQDNSKAKQEKVLTQTAEIGSLIHSMIERDLKDQAVAITAETEKPFHNWLELKEKHRIRAKHTELFIHSDRHGFAGTADIVGEFDGKECVMDIKTGFFSVKAGWQLGAYRMALQEMNIVNPECGMVGIQIHRDGSTGKPFVYEHYQFCEKTFLACLQVFRGLYFTKLNKMGWKYLK